ncbi:MAG: BF3164 family lipoprotein [Bacteroidales bacterium]|nr:BF3164 family lipoprotein [Bacteroidales bacterium]
MKQLIKLNFITFLIYTITACSPKNSLYDHFNREEILTANIIDTIRDPLVISGMSVLDTFLIFQTTKMSHNFQVYSLAGKFLNKLLPYGAGPDESLWANIVNTYDQLIVLDVNRHEVIEIPQSQILETHPKISKIKMSIGDGFLFGIAFSPMSNGRYLFHGVSKDKQPFAMTDSLFQINQFFGELDLKDNAEISDRIIRLVTQGEIKTNPDGDYFVFASSSGNVIKFYDCTNYSVSKQTNAYVYDLPIIESKETSASASVHIKEGSVVGTIGMTASDSHYFLLHVNKSWEENIRERTSDVVLVFDKQGNPIKKLVLDMKVNWIAYSKIDHSIYALKKDNEDNEVLLQYKPGL